MIILKIWLWSHIEGLYAIIYDLRTRVGRCTFLAKIKILTSFCSVMTLILKHYHKFEHKVHILYFLVTRRYLTQKILLTIFRRFWRKKLLILLKRCTFAFLLKCTFDEGRKTKEVLPHRISYFRYNRIYIHKLFSGNAENVSES